MGASNPSAGVDAEGHRLAIEAFVDAIARGERPAVDGREARKAVAIIRAVYESSARDGVAVAVDGGDDA